ncbi:MAG: hypothetical protein K1Y02_15130 [Candidatus Hydrogenedentes bacterium]|nr:hypothetical protein [Candidatus Hydrogenedentota bacterium]
MGPDSRSHIGVLRAMRCLMAVVAVACPCLPAMAGGNLCFLLPEDVAQSEGVVQTAQLPEKGIVMAPKDPSRPSLWYMPVAAIPLGGSTRVWYQRVDKQEKEYSDQRTLCVGDFTDSGWTLPAIGADSLPWGGPNNVSMRRSPHKPTWGGFNVFQILRVGTAYEMLFWDQPDETGKAGAMRASSPDGLAWEKRPGTVFTETNDAFTLMQVGDEYLLYQTKLEAWPDKPYIDNIEKQKRVIALRKSRDLDTWSPQEVFLRPDAQDAPECEFYLMKAFRYGDAYAGLIMKYYADPKLPGKHSAILKHELLVSKDGIEWQRPYRDTDLGFWAYADPFEYRGVLHFATWKDGGMVTATYKPGRLAGVRAEVDGWIVTRPVKGFSKGLSLNVDARDGWVEVSAQGPTAGQEPVVLGRVENVDGEDVSVPITNAGSLREEDETAFRVRLRHATVFGMRFE